MFSPIMDVDTQRAAILLRAANPRHSGFAGTDPGFAVPVCRHPEVTNATIAIYNEDNGKHSVELTQRFARAKPLPTSCC